MKSKTILFLMSILAITFLFSCKNEKKDTVETVFFTQDSLYKITFEKPLELDTFYSWRKEGCYGCDDYQRICFSKSTFPVEMQSGMLFDNYADSTYRIIIQHIDHYYKCESSKDLKLSPIIRKEFISQLKATNESADTLFLKEINISNFHTRVNAFKTKRTKSDVEWRYFIDATSIIDSNLFSFTADCRSKNCDGFINRFEKTIKSIKIERYK